MISTTTSAERSRSFWPPPLRAPSRSPPRSASPPTRSTGARPNAMPVTTVRPIANSRTRMSTLGVLAIGSVAGTSRFSSGTAISATITPSAPPTPASSRLSVISCRIMRSRPAPIAVRTASSRRRPSARASSRFARFAQAISSTHAAAPQSASSSSRDCCDTSSLNRNTEAPTLAFSFGILLPALRRDHVHLRLRLLERWRRDAAGRPHTSSCRCDPRSSLR